MKFTAVDVVRQIETVAANMVEATDYGTCKVRNPATGAMVTLGDANGIPANHWREIDKRPFETVGVQAATKVAIQFLRASIINNLSALDSKLPCNRQTPVAD